MLVAANFDNIIIIDDLQEIEMPNWCNNSLTLIAATKEDADNLYAHLNHITKPNDSDSDASFFGFFLPEPDYEDGDEEDAMPGWYWWRVNNWGTKWDASIHDVDWVDDKTVNIMFDTAWSPPTGIFQAMMDQGWGVDARYYEPGMCFTGSWIDGDEEYYEYAHCETPAEIRELVGEDLDDWFGISEWLETMLEEESETESSDGFDESDSHSGVEDFRKGNLAF